MIDATYVLLVPRAQRNTLMTLLRAEDLAPVSWREKRSFGGSEVYLTGPASAAREAHRRLTTRLAAPEGMAFEAAED